MLLASLLMFFGKSEVDPVKGQFHKDSNEHRIITYGADFGFTVSLSGTSSNWSGGGSNNIQGNGFTNAFVQVKQPNTSFDNVLKVNVGVASSRQLDNSNMPYRLSKKNIDNVFFDSKFGHSITNQPGMSIFGGLNFQTQLLPGYRYSRNPFGREVGTLNSSFMSQGQTQIALGLEYKPLSNFFVRMGYVTLKQTYVFNQSLYDIRNEQVIARVPKGDFLFNQLGVQIQLGVQKEYGKDKRLGLKANYLGFAPYVSESANLYSRIDFTLVAKLTKFINLNYTLIAIHDKDLIVSGADIWQNSWIFGLGYVYKL